MEHLKYLRVIRNLNILTNLLSQNRYEEIDVDYDYLLQPKSYELLSSAVQHNIRMLKKIVGSKNYGRTIKVSKQIIATLEQRIFNFKCEKKWSDLLRTESENVHFCMECSRNVFKVKNEKELLNRAEIGQCVFYSPDILERKLQKSCLVNIDDTYKLMGDPCTIEDMERHNTDKQLPFSENEELTDDNEIF